MDNLGFQLIRLSCLEQTNLIQLELYINNQLIIRTMLMNYPFYKKKKDKRKTKPHLGNPNHFGLINTRQICVLTIMSIRSPDSTQFVARQTLTCTFIVNSRDI